MLAGSQLKSNQAAMTLKVSCGTAMALNLLATAGRPVDMQHLAGQP
jgi:hypothetical protein